MKTGFRPYRSSNMRASDRDRENAVAYLKRHYSEGRLNGDELSQRVEAAYAAVTIGELEPLISDLPGSPLERSPDHGASSLGTPLKRFAALALAAAVGLAFVSALPAEVWLLLLVVALPVGAMLMFILLPIALAVAAGVWVLRRLRRGALLRSGDPLVYVADEREMAGDWRTAGFRCHWPSFGRPGPSFRR